MIEKVEKKFKKKPRNIFLTERQNPSNFSNRSLIINSNPEANLSQKIYAFDDEESKYNSFNFLALQVKKPPFALNYSNNKAKIEKEILDEIEQINKLTLIKENENEMNKTSKSLFLFKLSHNNSNKFKTCYNFNRNNGLIKGFNKPYKMSKKEENENDYFINNNTNINVIQNAKNLIFSNQISLNSSNAFNSTKAINTEIYSNSKKNLKRNETDYKHSYASSTKLKKNKLKFKTKNKAEKLIKNLNKNIENVIKDLGSIKDIEIHNIIQNIASERTNKINSNENPSIMNEYGYLSDAKNKNIKTANNFFSTTFANTSNSFNKFNNFDKSNRFNRTNLGNKNNKQKFERLKGLVLGAEYSNDANNKNEKRNSKGNTFTYFPSINYSKFNKKPLHLTKNKAENERDYRITKELYRIYNKNDVDIVIFGKSKQSNLNKK